MNRRTFLKAFGTTAVLAPFVHGSARLSDPKAQRVIDSCMARWDANKSDCNKFVKAVGGDVGISLPAGADADRLVDHMNQGNGWSELTAGDGPTAKAKADSGCLVIGGLKGSEHKPPRSHGHVLVVMSGPLDPTHNRYPRASWGTLGGTGNKDSFVNFSFDLADRDRVRYFFHTIA